MIRPILKYAEGVGIVVFLKNFVKNHPAEEYAKDAALELKKIMENEVGKEKANVIRDTIIPWVDKLYVTFRKTLLDDKE